METCYKVFRKEVLSQINIEMNTLDVVDSDNVEFSISYNNQIQVDNVGLNVDYIREALENTFMDFGEAECEE